ncbi:TPA: hypothetical protein HA244_05545 [Candidatus Micrarchaeota archaeon]|nr:hypothetical protein [Candidatus Micrarchaeota archaeon]
MVDVLAFVLTVVISFIPGMLLSIALFKHTVFNRWDKLFFGLVLSLTALPLLYFLEFLVLGMKLNFMLVVADALLVSFFSLAALYYQKHDFSYHRVLRKVRSMKERGVKDVALQHAVYAILLLVMASAFYIRFAPGFAPNFFEFDPYYYMKVTENLVRDGFVETFSPDVYYPEQLFNRVPPLSHYLTASWYVSYSALSGLPSYSKDFLIKTSQFYPPLVGALMAFLAFILLREEYNEYVGIVVASIFALMPQLVKKFASGVTEQQPYGLFAVMLVFSLYIIAINKKSIRLSLLAGFAALVVILSSQQYIWPYMVLTVYIGLQSILDYLSGTLDKHTVRTNAIVVAFAILGSFLLSIYAQGSGRFEFFNTNLLIFFASLLFSGALFAAIKLFPATTFRDRAKYFSGILAIALIAAVLSPVGGIFVGIVQNQLSIAFQGNALSKTIQENAATNPALFEPSFGILKPQLLLFLAASLASLVAVLTLLTAKHRNYAIISAFVSVVLLFLNNQLDSVLKFAANAIGSQELLGAINFFASSDIFIYLLVGLASTSIYYLFSEKKNHTALLFMLIFFPVAFIGLNKVKYLIQLGIAVGLAFGYVLGESVRAFDLLGSIFKIQNFERISKYFLVFVLLVGVGIAVTEAQTVENSMAELKQTRIPSDWVVASELTPSFSGTPISAMGWLYHNTNRFNPLTVQKCIGQFGWECRVLSWWDYGHWTTFYGETNSVLDPNNYFPAFDQETARAFVNGNPSDLLYVINAHHATHILVDSDLIGKWGALVFLSGTCSKAQSPICPETPEIDWKTQAPSSSKYEAEHYYEYLTVMKDPCPTSATAVPLPALQSSFGSVYCADDNYLYLLTRNGLDPTYKRKFTLTGSPNTIPQPQDDVSYLVPISQGTLLNLNPDLSYVGIENKVFYSAFTRFFFFEQVPGFKLSFRSPNSAVRIFEHDGSAALPPSPAPTPAPSMPVSNSTVTPQNYPPDSGTQVNATNASAGNSSSNSSG